MRNPKLIFLYGPSGAGKTTVGKLLAEQLKIPFLDLDMEIEQRVNRSITGIFQQDGEAGFRKIEQEQLRFVIQSQQTGVISLGGGTLLNPENLQMVEEHGQVLVLHSSSKTLAHRLKADPHRRPLLAENLEEKLEHLLQQRSDHYASFQNQVDTTHLTSQQAADEIQIRLGVFHLTGMGEYDVLVANGSLDSIGELLLERGLNGPIALVCDENTARLYADRVRDTLNRSQYAVHTITLPTGEETKNIQSVSRLWSGFLSAGLERSSTILSLGGGVISDLAGFAAATYLRGIRWVAIPTTLLSMADASLGGKTGIDLPEGKNLAGAFHPPSLVLQDPQVLRTLPVPELRSGLGEVLKHGVIADPSLWEQVVRLGDPSGWQETWPDLGDIVRRAVAVKVNVIEADPYEKGWRAALNLGHTIGHAVESLSEYQLRHGDCVSIGMVTEARMSELLGLADTGFANDLAGGLQQVGLPTCIPAGFTADEILNKMQVDKKKLGGKLKFALPVHLGEVREGMEVDEKTIRQAIVSNTARP